VIGGGRGPSAQVNAAADRLQSFLNKRGFEHRIHRAVILSHDSSEIGKVKDLTVDALITIDQLSKPTLGSIFAADSPELNVNRLVSLIEKDHAFHKRPPNGRKPTNRSNKRTVTSSNDRGA